ncbi:MAG: CPBP family glutamic-type intramembrane protease [Planctomycetota bacterium]
MADRRPSYVRASRDLAVGYLFLVPLLGFYQLGVMVDPAARNGAGHLFDEMLRRFGAWGTVILNLVLLSLLFFSLMRAGRARWGRPGIYGWMFLESLAWGALLVGFGRVAHAELLALPPAARHVVVAAGAGVYEEALFRLFLLGGAALLLRRGLDAPPALAFLAALAFSSIAFSWAHHTVGGEPWDRRVFVYRAVMGGALGVLYRFRGLGIVAYAHASYDVLLLLVSGG